MRARIWRKTALAGSCLIGLWLGNSAAPRAQQGDDPASLAQQIDQLRNAGKFADALPLAERLVALVKSRHAESSLEYAEALHQLAATYFFQSRHTEAEPIFLQVLAIRERALGRGHDSVLTVLDTLAALYQFTRRPQLAEPLHKQGGNVEAERTLQNALSLHENVVHSGQATLDAQYAHLFALVQLSGLYQRSDRYKDAVPLTERAVAMTEKKPHVPDWRAEIFRQ